MEIIVIIIIGLVLGYFFIERFENIDNYLFGESDYESFGRSVVMLSAGSGAIACCGFMYCEFIDKSNFVGAIAYIAPIVTIGAFSFGVFQCFLNLKSPQKIIGKSFFMLFACIIGFIIGAAGSVLIISLIILLVVLHFIAGAASASTSSKSKSSAYNDEADSLESERQGLLHDDNASQYEVDNFNDRVNSHNNNQP